MTPSKLLDNYLSDLKGSDSRKGSDVFFNMRIVCPFVHWAAQVVNHVTSYQIWHIVVFQNN